jgi:hypothetical protein
MSLVQSCENLYLNIPVKFERGSDVFVIGEGIV